jgi:hypothetical protein
MSAGSMAMAWRNVSQTVDWSSIGRRDKDIVVTRIREVRSKPTEDGFRNTAYAKAQRGTLMVCLAPLRNVCVFA